MGRNKDNLSFRWIIFPALLIFLKSLRSECFETIVTEQEASALRPGRLFVQMLTEPRSLIRLYEGLNLSFQMARHLGRTGTALLRLPFNRDILYNNYDNVDLDVWKRPYYARMPTAFPAEAPRFVKVSR